VSAWSWGERVTTEHTGHTGKREKGKGKRVGAGDPMISFSFFIRDLFSVFSAFSASPREDSGWFTRRRRDAEEVGEGRFRLCSRPITSSWNSLPSVAQRNRQRNLTAFELGPPSRKRECLELGREGNHGAHRAHGEEGRELKVESPGLISFSFFHSESLLGVLGALCGSKKPPKKPHGVRA
jgi:hypothetical protein